MSDGLSDEQREQLRTQFREGMGSIPEDTPELRERFAHIGEVLALADALHARHESWPTDMAVNEYEAPYIAQAVLASQWLADRDARVRDEARAQLAAVLPDHVWRGGYFCQCGHELNSPAGWFAHLSSATGLATPDEPGVTRKR